MPNIAYAQELVENKIRSPFNIFLLYLSIFQRTLIISYNKKNMKEKKHFYFLKGHTISHTV